MYTCINSFPASSILHTSTVICEKRRVRVGRPKTPLENMKFVSKIQEKKWKNYDKTFHKMNYFKSFSPGSTYAALMWPRIMYQPLPGHRFSLIWKLYKRNENKKFTKSFSSHSPSPASEAVGDHPCSSEPVSQPSIQWAAIYMDLWTTLEFTPRAQSLEKLHRPNTAHISTANAELSQIFAYPKGMTRGWNALPYQESPKN